MRTVCLRALSLSALSVMCSASLSAAISGAVYTSLGNGETVNANVYDLCSDVYLNGGPQNQNAAGLPDGEYFFQVTNPNGSVLLSTTPAMERRVKVVGGVIFGRAVGLPPTGMPPNGYHQEGNGSVPNADNGSIPVQLWIFDPTPNNGGEYKVWLIPIAEATVEGDGITLTFASNAAKTDNFKCVHDGGTGGNLVLIGGRKYFDANLNGVYDDDGSEEWTDAGGFDRVTLNICYTAPEAEEVCDSIETDSLGTWSYDLPEGSTLTVCEVAPAGYAQTGPLDGDNITNGDASADALDGCWAGGVTTLGLAGLNFGNVGTVTISGVKYYDANVNGEMDGGEVTIPGFKIVLEISYGDTTDTVEVWTDSNGEWSYEVPVGSDVTVCEEIPLGSWVQTAPALGCHSLEDVSENTSNLDFGNVCLGPGGGKTLGFWSNKNGEKTMNDGGSNAPELALLVSLNLRNADGSNFDPASYTQFRTWILSATATNMAYMLSAQLAAMELNVEAGFVSGGSIVYSPCAGFVTINDLMDDANTSLGSYPNTTSPHPERANQECLKSTLDDANNNLNFVQSSPCDVVYPPET